jgi:hypothetical protein
MRTLARPVPLACEKCGQIIGADDDCSWRERVAGDLAKLADAAGVRGLVLLSPGFEAMHTSCGQFDQVPGRTVVHYAAATRTSIAVVGVTDGS